MAGQSLIELLSSMNGKSITLGWDAVVSYDQLKINMLMEQQYVSKAAAGRTLEPITEVVAGAGVTNYIEQLLLGTPLLSFEEANLTNSRAKLTMPFLAGHISTVMTSAAATNYVDEMSTVVPGSHYILTMTIELENTTGNISQTTGEVFLDLSKGYSFTVNFGGSSEEEDRIGQKFKELYEKAPPDMKKYVLGLLDPVGNYALTPILFLIKTQPAPTGSLNGGAILLLVQTQCSAGGSGGNLPGASFPYLIPNDTDPAGLPLYSGVVLIRSKTLFQSILGPHYSNMLGATFNVNNGNTQDLACSLTASGGNYNTNRSYAESDLWVGPDAMAYTEQLWSGHTSYIYEQTPVIMPCNGLTITPRDGELNVAWANIFNQDTTRYIYQQRFGPGSGASSRDQKYITVSHNGGSINQSSVSDGNVVRFTPISQTNDVILSNTGWLNSTDEAELSIRNQLISITSDALTRVSSTAIPTIDLFTLANLLFPEKNTLQLSRTSLPGDLACFGQLDPERSSFRISPLQTTVGANQTQQFRIDSPDYADETVGWSVQAATEGLAGTIDANGLYRAPPASPGISVAHQDIITARIGAGDTLKQASAVVAVVDQGITVNPTFKVYATPGVTLRATTQGTTVTWTKLSGDGSLQSDAPDGKEVLFVAPSPLTQSLQTAVIEAHDTNSGARCRSTILMIKGNLSFQVEPVFIPPLGPLEEIPLTVRDPEGNEAPAGMFVWTVLSGDGTVSQGVYTAPADIQDTCAVISIALSSYPSLYGYAVIPLHR
ncbi:Cobalt-zinc-cadmium resistance protein CzcA [Pseudomonas chlororaphis]|uniref:Cobalt-zinc-cadmium resistance protein CzcA n=1 Tax=Pseudomonas chlororaphis TaxID=587753 RepID=A0A3G7TVB4_9PSED|nr:hypothetical protein [Pseudomonas chlororaphis]AZE50342.1 Cobalt-zinc-cadmium resistance protein CzcA [Pseudomonas chlororaphis]